MITCLSVLHDQDVPASHLSTHTSGGLYLPRNVMHFGCGCTSEAVLHSLFRSLATPSSVHRSRTSEAVPPLAVLRWDFSSLAALVDMSMPSWLEPSPGTRGNKPTPATDDVRVAAAYSAAGAAAEAAQAAADLLMGSRRTPRKKSRTTSPASTQKGTLKSNSGSKARSLHAAFDQEHSVKVNMVPRSEAGPLCTEAPQHNTAAIGMESDTADISVHSSGTTAGTAATSVHSSGITAGKRHYTTRGQAGTFQGKRPPKDPVKLEKFLKAKAAYEKEKMELQRQKAKTTKRYTPTQQSYQAFQRASNRSQSAGTREHFIAAAAEWQKQKAREVAEEASLF